MNAVHTSIGIAVVGAHVAAFALLAQRCGGDEFVVDIHGPNASPTLAITGDVPSSLADRVVESRDDAPPGPGLHRKRWSIAYRGGFSRSVGAAQLVGPFQDPNARTCTGRVAVSQRLLDDGTMSPSTVAGQMKLVLEHELAGQSITGAGSFDKVESIALRWSRLEWHPDDRAMVGDAPNGYVRAAVTIAFDRVKVPVVIALVPIAIANNSPSNDAASNDAASNNAPSNNAPSNNAPSNNAPSNNAPSNNAPSNNAPSNNAPSSDAPSNNAPSNDAASNNAPSNDAPSNNALSNNALSNNAPSSNVTAPPPMPPPPELRFRIASRAELAFGNRVAQWISDHVGGNALATRLARDEIDDALLSTLAPPPPFDLGGGQSLVFTYCGDAPEIIEGSVGAIPFAVEIHALDRDPTVLPPKRGKAQHLAIGKDAQLAIDLDVDALNAVLFELWRGGFLDRQLASAGLDAKFNADPIVQELLSLRISPVRLALPPVIAPAGDHLRLSADARVTIVDGASTTVGRVWGGLDFKLGADAAHGDASATRDGSGAHTDARVSGSDGERDAIGVLDVELGALELSCERTPTRLAPCYSDLVAAIRGRGSEFHGALTNAFAAILTDIFVERRLGASGLPADLVIKSAVPRVTASRGNASLHLDLAASLVPAVH